ncbi:MAG: cupin domain-containing protein [Dehalococcoidia bacterium]
MSTPIEVISGSERESNATPQTAGMVREQAFAADDRWVGFVRAEPGQWGGWHHHGEHDTYLYVLKGALEFEVEGANVVQIKPNDFVHVPAGVVHRERAAGPDEGQVVLFRMGSGPPVVNVEAPA